jgi:hypothetical protein
MGLKTNNWDKTKTEKYNHKENINWDSKIGTKKFGQS